MKQFKDTFFFSVVSELDDEYKSILDIFTKSIKSSKIRLKHNIINTGSHSGVWQSKDYLNNVFKKLYITYDKLSSGIPVICSDIDIIFYRDFYDFLHTESKKFDVIFSIDHQFFCTGFFYVKPTPLTTHLFNPNITIKPWSGDQGDQGYINNKLIDLEHNYKDLKVGYICPSIAPYGKYIYDKLGIINNPILAHFNWTVGAREKLEKMNLYNSKELIEYDGAHII